MNVQRLWREEGLRVPQRHLKKGRLYLNNGSCIRLRSCWQNHVWIYDFVADRLFNGKKIRMLTLIDEYTRKCLAIEVGYHLNSQDILDTLREVFIREGLPDYIRSDNGSEFTATLVKEWLKALGVKTAYIEPGSPWAINYQLLKPSFLRKKLLSKPILFIRLQKVQTD